MDRPFATVEDVEAACLAKPGAFLDRPFGPGTLVYKVTARMFALVASVATPLTVSLKCDPELAVALRSRYPAITPGYHLNKRHWNTVLLDGSVPGTTVQELIDLSYDLVVAGLTAAERRSLAS
jgi:predicted DNA-binding protein (MmcQ/YjbR family)